MTETKAAIGHATSRTPGIGVNEKIDLCRGIFAYLVVIAHGRELAWSMHPTVGKPGLWETLLGYSLGTGIYWVMGFFVISGYCIQLSVERSQASGSFFFKEYMVARLTRILPLYYLALLVVVCVEWLIQSNRPFIWPDGVGLKGLMCQLAGIHGCTLTFGSFGPSWSITNELFYYVFFGFLVVGCGGRRHLPPVIGLVICVIVGGSLQALHAFGPKSTAAVRLGMLFGLGTNWFLGALVAQHRQALISSRVLSSAARIWPILIVLAMALHASERIRAAIVFLLCGVAFTLMLIRFLQPASGASSRGEVELSRIRRLPHEMGLTSYPTYLFHSPILMLVGAAIMRWSLTENRGLIWIVSAIISLAFGMSLGYLAERPIMAWRSGILARRRLNRAEGDVQPSKGPLFASVPFGRTRIAREGIS